MNPSPVAPAAIARPSAQEVALSGTWTARGIDAIGRELDALSATGGARLVVDGGRIEALDTAGAWVLHKLLLRLRGGGGTVEVRALRSAFAELLDVVGRESDAPTALLPPASGNEAVIEIRKLVTRFGEHVVHAELDIEVRRGEIFALIGGSGSGKSRPGSSR